VLFNLETLSVLINGSPTQEFGVQCGLL